LATLALLAALAAACNDTTEADPPVLPRTGGGGSRGAGGGSSGGSSGTGGLADAAEETGAGACPQGAFHYDGGPCQCQMSIPDVCPGMVNGVAKQVCVDVKTDPINCGQCGMACDPSVGCKASKCGTKATQFASAGAGCGSLKIVYSGGKLYWADKGHGTINSLAMAGGTPTQIAMGEMAPLDLVVNMGSVYWINSGSRAVRKFRVGDTAASTVAGGNTSDAGTGTIHAIALSADGGTLYYSRDTCIYRIATTGATPTKACVPIDDAGTACPTVAGSTCVGSSEWGSNGIPSALAVDAKNAYYTTDQSGNVEIMSLATGLEFKVAQSQGSLLLDTIHVDAGHLYWANDNGVYVNTSFVVGADAGIGGTLVGQTPGAVNAVTAFAIGSTSVYYGEDGYVEKSPPTSQTAGTVATDILARNVPVLATDDAGTHQPMPNSIALDGTNVYWTTGDCKIMTLADSPQ
jgi:hypothetical protein